MKREYWFVLIIYIVMQFSSIIGIPIFSVVFRILGGSQTLVLPVWLVVKFAAALFIVFFVLRKEIKHLHLRSPGVLKWAVFGGLLALASQYAASFIESLFGLQMLSENTQNITRITQAFPFAFVVSAIAAPILEEIVFRKIIFGTIHKHSNFFVSALISSILFGLIHLDPEHLLKYSLIGFIFAFIYSKRRSILSPIFAHIIMNSIVLIGSLIKGVIN